MLWPSLIPPQSIRNAHAAQDTVHQIYYAEKVFQFLNNGQFGTLEQLKEQGLLESQLDGNSKNGYRFELRQKNDSFVVSATPLEYGRTGSRSYFMDEGGLLRLTSEENQEATANSPICLSKTHIISGKKE